MTRQTIGRPAVPVAAAAVLALLLAGCGSGDDDTTLPPVEDTTGSSTASPSPAKSPSTAKSPEPSVSPAPEGADLNRAQESAYKKALKDYNKARKAIQRINANPKPNKKTRKQIKAVTFLPASEQFWETVQRYHKANVHIEGRHDFLWQVPVEVALDTKRPRVVWKQCTALGSLKVVKANGEEIPQEEDKNNVGKITSYVDSDGLWRVAKSEQVGSC